MAATSLYEIQKAIFNKLKGDNYLNTLVTGIFGDNVPESQNFPFIQINDATETSFNTFDRKGKEVTFTIHIWSQYKGFKECYEIHERVLTLLDYKTLNVNNFSTVYIRLDNVNAIREEDRITRQLAVIYRVIVQGG